MLNVVNVMEQGHVFAQQAMREIHIVLLDVVENAKAMMNAQLTWPVLGLSVLIPAHELVVPSHNALLIITYRFALVQKVIPGIRSSSVKKYSQPLSSLQKIHVSQHHVARTVNADKLTHRPCVLVYQIILDHPRLVVHNV